MSSSFYSTEAAGKCYGNLRGVRCHYKKLPSVLGHLEVVGFKQYIMMI